MSDFKYAVRQIRRSPGFAIVAMSTLAIGIGANTALFSLANAILARPMPEIHGADQMVWITPTTIGGKHPLMMSYPDFEDFRSQTGVFADAAAIGSSQFSLSSDGDPVRVRGEYVSASYFRVLQVNMLRGRGFTPDEDHSPGGNAVAVISARLWAERFSSRADIVGHEVTINGRVYTVVGVAPEQFNGAQHSERQSLWVPISMVGAQPADQRRLLTSRGSWWLRGIGRLKDGVSEAQANAAMAVVAARIAKSDSANHGDITAGVFPVRSGMTPGDMNDVGGVGSLAAAVTLLILLIACANVSNLLLARAAGRRREIALRLSLGASRARIVRQLLAESIVLSAGAAALGLLLATWATSIMASIIPAPLDITPDGRVLSFTILAAVLTGIGFGVIPALHATRADVATALKDATVGFDRRRSTLQNSFVVAQLSLSLVLLTMAGMFMGALYKSSHIDVHFDATPRVLAASFDLGLQGYDTAAARAFLSQLSEKAAALPGVQSISITNTVPMSERLIGAQVVIEGHAPATANERDHRPSAELYQSVIDVGYFETLGIPLTTGRDFDLNDRVGATPVTIVSEDFAQAAWPGESAIGKRIAFDAQGPFHTVVGVAHEALTAGVRERRRPMIYIAQRQHPAALDLTILLRSSTSAAPLITPLRAAIRELNPNLPVFGVQTLDRYRADRDSESRLGSTLMTIFGLLALLLATVGVYAVMAFSVAQRQREIGVRVAVGAAGRQIVRLFIGEGLRLAGAGLIVGLVLSVGAAKLLSSFFLGLTMADAIPVTAVAVILTAAAIGASWIPARRAARVDPMVALRGD